MQTYLQKLDAMRHKGHVNRLPVLMIVSPSGNEVTQQGVFDVMVRKLSRVCFSRLLVPKLDQMKLTK